MKVGPKVQVSGGNQGGVKVAKEEKPVEQAKPMTLDEKKAAYEAAKLKSGDQPQAEVKKGSAVGTVISGTAGVSSAATKADKAVKMGGKAVYLATAGHAAHGAHHVADAAGKGLKVVAPVAAVAKTAKAVKVLMDPNASTGEKFKASAEAVSSNALAASVILEGKAQKAGTKAALDVLQGTSNKGVKKAATAAAQAAPELVHGAKGKAAGQQIKGAVTAAQDALQKGGQEIAERIGSSVARGGAKGKSAVELGVKAADMGLDGVQHAAHGSHAAHGAKAAKGAKAAHDASKVVKGAKVAKAAVNGGAAVAHAAPKLVTAAAKPALQAAGKAGAVAAAKAGGRFVPGLNIAIAVADTAVAGYDIHKAIKEPSAKNITGAVLSGVTAVGSIVAATNIPVVSQIGAGVSAVAGLTKAAVDWLW